MREAYIDLSAQQLEVLCSTLDLGLPAGLEPGLLEGRPDAVRDHLQAQAVSDLVARQVLTGPEDDRRVDPAVDDVLRTVAAPGLLLIATLEAGGVAETRFYAVSPDLGVEQAPLSSTLHRFTPFVPSEVLERALRFVDLRPHDALPVDGFRVPASVLDTVDRAVLDGDEGEAAEVLAASGVDVEAASAYLRVAAGDARTVSITVFYRPTETEVAGGSMLWLDGGLDGLWVVETIEDGDDGHGQGDDPMVALQPSTGRDVAREVLSYLPPPFAQPPLAR